jgi:hypothetical protein
MALSTTLSIARASRDSSPRMTALPTRGQGFEQVAQIDRLEACAAQLRVEPRHFGDVDDQPVEPHHVAPDDVDQLAPKRRIVDLGEAVDRGAKRCERVLQLVGDVGGERLGRVDPRAQRLGHVAERPGEQADLVAPLGQRGDGDVARPAEADLVRGAGQPAQGQGDGPG